MSRIGAFLFPPEPRKFPARRQLKTVLRAAHVVCAAGLLGVYLFTATETQHAWWFHAAGISGVLLLLFDIHETLAFLLQVRGVVVVLKIIVMGLLTWLGGWAGFVLGAIIAISVVSSHASSGIRYHMLWGGDRITGSTTKG